jgi:hypothetical protein
MAEQQNAPEKIQVTSPELDALNETAQRVSEWLHKDMKETVRALQVLPTIPSLLADFKTRIVEQFKLLFTNQVETQMIAREANIRVLEQKEGVVENHVKNKRKQFEEAKQRVSSRYNRLSDMQTTEHSNFLRQLDGDAYDIPEKIYPNQVLGRFSFDSVPSYRFLAAHTVESAVVRNECLSDGYGKAAQAISEFLNRREQFYRSLGGSGQTQLEEGTYELPYWIVGIEDRSTGIVEEKVLFEWDAAESAEGIDADKVNDLRNLALQYKDQCERAQASPDELAQLVQSLKTECNLQDDDARALTKDCTGYYEIKES